MIPISIKEIIEKNIDFGGYVCSRRCGKKLLVKDIKVTLNINDTEIIIPISYVSHEDGTHESAWYEE